MVLDGYNGVPVEIESAEDLLNKTYQFRQEKLIEDINQDISYVIHTDISETGELGPERAYLSVPTQTTIKMKMDTGNYGEPEDIAKFASRMGEWKANVDAAPKNILNHLRILQPFHKKLNEKGLEPKFRIYGESKSPTVEEAVSNYREEGLINRIDLQNSLNPDHNDFRTGFVYDGENEEIHPYALNRDNLENRNSSVIRDLEDLLDEHLNE